MADLPSVSEVKSGFELPEWVAGSSGPIIVEPYVFIPSAKSVKIQEVERPGPLRNPQTVTWVELPSKASWTATIYVQLRRGKT